MSRKNTYLGFNCSKELKAQLKLVAVALGQRRGRPLSLTEVSIELLTTALDSWEASK